MKRIHFLGILLTLFFLSACQSNGKKAENIEEEQVSMALSQKDTLAVTELVDKFMNFAKNKEYAQAAAMLYITDIQNPDQEPQPLDNEGMQRIATSLQIFPVQSYEINQMIFKEAEDNEVKCTIHFSETGKTNWYFKPVRYLGNWRLCLRDSDSGDRPIDE